MPRNLERRLRELERRLLEKNVGFATSEGFAREFVSGVLAAIAHVRRAPIDRPPHGYEIEKLHALKPFSLAQYVAALTVQQHPDEDEARALLAQTGDDPVLPSMIDAVVDQLGSSQRREDGF